MKREDSIKVAGVVVPEWAAVRTLPAGTRRSAISGIPKEGRNMNYTPKDYSKLLGLAGFSETLLKNHFTLYQGYVTNTNKVLDILGLMAKDGKTETPEDA